VVPCYLLLGAKTRLTFGVLPALGQTWALGSR
jgi:hypothetical protein